MLLARKRVETPRQNCTMRRPAGRNWILSPSNLSTRLEIDNPGSSTSVEGWHSGTDLLPISLVSVNPGYR